MPYRIPRITQPFDARLTLPGSKSIALRQLAMAALADGVSTISAIPPCEDIDAMLGALDVLGATVERISPTEARITGPIDLGTGAVQLDLNMSGASTRLLLGIAGLRHGATTLDGHPSLQVRPNGPLLDTLRSLSCQVTGEGGLPATVQGPAVLSEPAEIHVDGSKSSQFVSGALLIAPQLAMSAEVSTVRVCLGPHVASRPYLDITLGEMRKRDVQTEWVDEHTIAVAAGRYRALDCTIEGDATAASYFAMLATVHASTIRLENLGTQTAQGDYGFMDVVEQLGAKVERNEDSTQITGPAQLSAIDTIDLEAMPDAALTLIASAPLVPGETEITGLATLPLKECDRLGCSAYELQQMGVAAEATADSIRIPQVQTGELTSHQLNTYHDHRMAMAFSMLASITGRIEVDDATVVGKTYPHYWEDYEAVASSTT